jgi:hypothetical protein
MAGANTRQKNHRPTRSPPLRVVCEAEKGARRDRPDGRSREDCRQVWRLIVLHKNGEATTEVRHMAMTNGEKLVFDRLFNVLSSQEAWRINFRLDSVHFVGLEAFLHVRSALTNSLVYSGRQFGGTIEVRVVELTDGAGAKYNHVDNVFKFPNKTLYGVPLGQQMTMVHEAVHAFLDMRKMSAISKLTSESIAYVAGALFYFYHTTAAGGGYSEPWWAKPGKGSGQFSPAYAIAKLIWNTPGATVPQTALDKLQDAIKLDPLYDYIKADPGVLTGYTGI